MPAGELDAFKLISPEAVSGTSPIRSQYAPNCSRLPSVFNAEPHVADGGILSYGPNIPDLFERSASYVDKVLRGTRPNNLPVELPTKHDLWINITAAKAIDIEIPESIRLRRRVIE